MERREFIAGCSATLMVAGVNPSQLLASARGSQISATPVPRARFDALMGTEFRVYREDGRFLDKVRLAAIEDGPCCPGLEQFSVLWEGAYADVLPEGVYTLTAPQEPGLSLAMTPISEGRHPRYRAVFNLLEPTLA
jgi:hypothetical protein